MNLQTITSTDTTQPEKPSHLLTAYSLAPHRFVKRPIEIEAIQWTRDNLVEVHEFCPDAEYAPEFKDLWIQTLEGEMMVEPGAWIIKGVKGEFYPCRNDIFVESYSEVANG